MRFYEDITKNSYNRLPQRSYYIPKGVASCKLLNGIWKFAYSENGDRLIEPKKWNEISVPSCWQTSGYDTPNYVNIQYPFPYNPPYVPMLNPAAIYERDFIIDDISFSNYLVLEGVSSSAQIWINGVYAGYTQGSHLQSEFDISDFVVKGKNIIRIKVWKWCCGSYFEGQDQFRMNGIFRDVYLLSRPKKHITDFEIKTDNNGKIFVKTDIISTISVYDNEVLLDRKENIESCELTVKNPILWNAEKPYLYDVVFEASGEIIKQRIGFRTIDITDDGVFTINGSPIKMKGVNHHDTTPDLGWYMTDDRMLQDLKLMKSLNINTIRTSHYPPPPKFIDLCDEMGFYVILETDIESHGSNSRRPGIVNYDFENPDWVTSKPEWQPLFIERIERSVERDKNHTSILSWSIGNESGFGKNHIAMVNWIKNRDNSRPVHSEDACHFNFPHKVDFESRMYSSPEWIEEFLENKDNIVRPFFLCEFSHAMGNGPGDVFQYAELFYKHPRIMGGCVWEWADHAVLIDGIQKYGGDFNEQVHDKNFCCDGMVFSNRSFKAGTYEVKAAYAPYRFEYKNNGIEIENRYDFTDLSECSFRLVIEADGAVIFEENLQVTAKPRSRVFVNINANLPQKCNKGLFATLYMWDNNGLECGNLQSKIPCQKVKNEFSDKPIVLLNNDFEIIANGKDFLYTYDKILGNLSDMKISDKSILIEPIKFSAFRAPTDNDGFLPGSMALKWTNPVHGGGENLNYLYNYIENTAIENNKIIITGNLSGVARRPFFNYSLGISIFDSGRLHYDLSGKVHPDAVWLPRLGFEIVLPKNAEKFKYFGAGPMESYLDMCHHANVGWHESNADAEYVNYVRPQEHGSHCFTRELRLSNGLIILSDEPFSFSVRHTSTESLYRAKHTDEIVFSENTYLHIDYKMSGLGSSSCGPQPREDFRLAEKEIKFSFDIIKES